MSSHYNGRVTEFKYPPYSQFMKYFFFQKQVMILQPPRWLPAGKREYIVTLAREEFQDLVSVYIWTQLTSRALLYGCLHLDPAHALQFKPSFQALLCPNSLQKKHQQGLVSVYIWTQLTGRACSLKVFTFWPSLIIAYSINPQVLVWQDDLWMAGQYLDYLVSTRQENESKRMKVKVWVWT